MEGYKLFCNTIEIQYVLFGRNEISIMSHRKGKRNFEKEACAKHILDLKKLLMDKYNNNSIIFKRNV